MNTKEILHRGECTMGSHFFKRVKRVSTQSDSDEVDIIYGTRMVCLKCNEEHDDYNDGCMKYEDGEHIIKRETYVDANGVASLKFECECGLRGVTQILE